MKINRNDIVVVADGKGRVLRKENFRTCDRIILKFDVVPEKFKGFNWNRFAYFYEEILELNGEKVQLKRNYEGNYTNQLKEKQSVFKN